MSPALPRRLALMRHAKSAWDSDAPTDHERPLNPRGRRDAPRMGAWLVAQGWVPDLVVLSDSARTRETWARLAPSLPTRPEVMESRLLYHAGLAALRQHAAGWPDGARTVLALGHNPGWEEALARLSGRWETMTTGNVALLEGRGETWQAALGGAWSPVALARPKELPQAAGSPPDAD